VVLGFFKNINERHDTLKVLLETVQHMGIGNDFFNRTPIEQEIRSITDKYY
jgi:hypothetical protein